MCVCEFDNNDSDNDDDNDYDDDDDDDDDDDEDFIGYMRKMILTCFSEIYYTNCKKRVCVRLRLL